MKKEFSFITYVGGIATLPQCCDLTVVIDNSYRRISLKKNGVIHSHLNFEDIEEVSLYKKNTLGAIISNVLAGSTGSPHTEVEARKRHVSTIYISYKKNGKIRDLLLKAKRQTANLYASISSAIATDEPVNFDRSRTTMIKEQHSAKFTIAGVVVWTIFGIMAFVLLKSCINIH
ncbi:MAG TPA: hypothetical protein VH396_05220 [Chitinophagaceae bacterium]|jgi:hypothetical protein